MKYQMQFCSYLEHTQRTEKATTKPSMTIPDQALTVAQLVERNKRGLPLGGARTPQYQDNPEADFLPDIAKLDLAEIHELKDQAAASIKESKEKLEKIEENRKGRKMKQLELQIEELKRTQNPKPPTNSQEPV